MKKKPYSKRNIEYYMMKSFLEDNSDLDSIFSNIVSEYRKMYITEHDEKLLNLFFKEDVTQKDLDGFLNEWDIEEEGGHKALMLSYFMKQHPEFTYSQYIEPRLNGILKFYRFKNLNFLSHYKKICTAIKKEGIDILILKGGALRFYNPEFPRIMGDIDILVPEKDYETAKSIALSFGYKYREYKHSIDLHDPKTDMNLFDIHHKIDMQTNASELINEDLFKRSSLENVFTVDGIYVPCPEDMMFILLINLNKNLMRRTSPHSIMYSIFDSNYLVGLKPNFDWDIVKQNAIKTKTEPQVLVATKFINEFVSKKLPVMFEKESYERCVLYIYKQWYLKTLKKKSHSLFIDTVKNVCKDISYYFKFRYLYIMHRQKHIRTNTERAKSILETQDLIQK